MVYQILISLIIHLDWITLKKINLNTPQGPSTYQLQQQHLLEQQNVVLEQILKSQNIQKTEDSGNVNKGRIHFSLFYPNLSHWLYRKFLSMVRIIKKINGKFFFLERLGSLFWLQRFFRSCGRTVSIPLLFCYHSVTIPLPFRCHY